MRSWTPPPRRKYPPGIGAKEPPQQDRRRQQHQPKRLVASVEPRLLRPPPLLGHLLVIRFDAGLNHGGLLQLTGTTMRGFTKHKYRGPAVQPVPTHRFDFPRDRK